MSRSSSAAIAVAMLALCAPSLVHAQTVRAGLWKPRGYFPKLYAARIEVPLRVGQLQGVAVGGEIVLGSHENISATTLSAYVMVRHDILPPKSIVSPYVAAGAGGHILRDRVTVPDVRVLTKSETTVKGHAWAGVRLPGIDVLHPYVETRWTIPSDYVLDYIAFGVAF